MIPNILKEPLGLRDSMRLLAAADIVITFGCFGEFSRSEVVREFEDVYGAKCLDRALADLEAGNALAIKQRIKNDVSAGASYCVTPQKQWRPRSARRIEERKRRHGRGGCRN